MDDEYPPFDIPKLTNLDPLTVHESVVKLSFTAEKLSIGTGFFIEIPNSPCEVILTAGHNLYSHDTKAFTTDLQVLFPHPRLPMLVPPEHVKVSEGYVKDRNNKESDYGVILIPYNKQTARRGLGFNMMNAFTQLRGEVKVSKYGDKTPPGRPRMSSGSVTEDSTENQLQYNAETEPGASGSPVWFEQNSCAVVVAVHNNGPESGSKGGARRGARISLKLLRDVFTWANLDMMAKRLRAENRGREKIELPKSGLFMVFGRHSFAQLQRGFGTTFDVLLAQVKSGEPSYALMSGTQWVMFDFERQQVVLVDSLRKKCLFEMKELPKHPGVVSISVDGARLRMDGSVFKPQDLLQQAQKTGLSIIRSKPSPIHQFIFESDPSVPFKPCTHLIVTAAQAPDSLDDPQQDLSSMLCPECLIKVSRAGH